MENQTSLGQDDGSYSQSTIRQPDPVMDNNLSHSNPSIISNSNDSEAVPAQALRDNNVRSAIYKAE